MGFRLNLKGVFPVPSHFLANSSPSRLPSSVGGREASFNSGRPSFLSVNSDEGVLLAKEPPKAYASSAIPQTLENGCFEIEEMKVNIGKGSQSHTKIDKTHEPIEGKKSSSRTSPQACNASHYSLLMENLDVLEETFADSDVLTLEREIVLQLGRLGALKLFNICFSRTIKASSVLDLSDVPASSGEFNTNGSTDSQKDKIVVRSRKKKPRQRRRDKLLEKPTTVSSQVLPLKTLHGRLKMPNVSSGKRVSDSRSRRLMIARNEAEMSKGIKVVANLERIRTTLEEETGKVVSLSCWAEAAGVNEKVLQQQLQFGWYCRDELLRSTRSLVLYFARNYRGLGIAHEDLIQAGSVGVLQGAERFDHTRGYRFSTYVQYWIRKSISRMVARHARGIQVPCMLSKAIVQIQKAQKALSQSHGKNPDEDEIAKFTGLSLAKIRSANKCMRIVGSIDQKIGDCMNAKYLEFIPDLSIRSPEKTVMRQHMEKDIYDLLNGLDARERQVMVLRFGLKGSPPRSLEEIGRLFHVSKEWIRRIERKAMTKMRDTETCRNLSHYLDL
ncbi:RNA polymerase sigma-70 [Corchorus capsularis]|uniref:RNA polymerase sigma-70 n=1 Tax=Corchorus capsularis TaxID=210143 RepID=A0A1R3H945_COCAP|nr:RNA polymerase sigma-70 [Corchorus capsularis]